MGVPCVWPSLACEQDAWWGANAGLQIHTTQYRIISGWFIPWILGLKIQKLVEMIVQGTSLLEATAGRAAINATNWPPELHPVHHVWRQCHAWTAVWKRFFGINGVRWDRAPISRYRPPSFHGCQKPVSGEEFLKKLLLIRFQNAKDPTHVWQSWSTSQSATCWPACPPNWWARLVWIGGAARHRGTHLLRCNADPNDIFVTILLRMRHALEDQETKGRVVVEEIAVGGQVVRHRQSDS